MIDFESVWTQVRNRYSSEVELTTISTHREFKAVYDSSYDEIIVMPLSTKMPRHITKKDFQRVWEKFVKVEVNPYRPGHYQRETQNASYTLALIREILEGEVEKQSGKLSQERTELSELKNMKGSLSGIVKFTWDEIEEKLEKFIEEGRR